MTLLPIIVAPDPRLKVQTKIVEKVDKAVRTRMDDMLETMYAANGIGLAGPQVGDLRKIIVVDCATKNEQPSPIKMANPEILEVSPDYNTYNEGCLSFPEHYADVIRPESIRVRYLDETNTLRECEATGILATCIQHEIDHLDGILFVDRISSLKRNIILRKLKKMKKKTTEV